MKAILQALQLPETATEADALKEIAALRSERQQMRDAMVAELKCPWDLIPKFREEVKRRSDGLRAGMKLADIQKAARNQMRSDGLLHTPYEE